MICAFKLVVDFSGLVCINEREGSTLTAERIVHVGEHLRLVSWLPCTVVVAVSRVIRNDNHLTLGDVPIVGATPICGNRLIAKRTVGSTCPREVNPWQLRPLFRSLGVDGRVSEVVAVAKLYTIDGK